MAAAFLAELLLTFFFLLIIAGTTANGAATGLPGIPIGFALTLIHLIPIPTNTSADPARNTGPVLFAGGPYLGQLWLFWVAPIVAKSALIGYRTFFHSLSHSEIPE